MDRCPAEICSEIYAFACIDDGRTGRSLSLVSRFINATSKPFKLQSVAVIGHTQLYAFANMVENTPASLLRIQSIFISAHSRETASDPRALAPEYARRKDTYAAFTRILKAIAHSVRIIHAFFVFFRPFVLLPTSMPALEEFVLHGPLETATEADGALRFSSLKHLYLTSCCSPPYLLGKILPLAPSLLHLRICASERSEAVSNNWRAMVDRDTSAFPPHLEQIGIHAPTRPKAEYPELLNSHDQIMTALYQLVDTDNRVVVLQPLPFDLFSMISIREAEGLYHKSAAGYAWW